MVKLTSTRRQLLASYTAALGSLALGAGIGWSSPSEKEIVAGYFKFPVSERDFDWVTAFLPLGAATICIPIGFIMELIGRKRAMIMMAPLFALAWTLLLWPQNLYMLYVGRFLLGMCGGAYSVLIPVYSTEIAQTHQRGIMGCSFQISMTMGVLYAWTIGTIFNVLVTTILCGILPIICVICFYFLPESPVYLLKRDEWDQAIDTLKKLRGDNLSVYADLRELADSINYANAVYEPFCKAICLKRTRRCLFLASMLVTFQQMSGADIILYNAYDLLKSYTHTLIAKLYVILVGIVQVIVTCLITFLIDRWGRRLLYMIATFYLSLCCLVIGLFYHIWERNRKTAEQITWLVLIVMGVYVVMYSAGLGGIPWLYNAELFSINVKGFGVSFAATIHWLMASGYTLIYINVRDHLSFSTMFFIHTFTLLAIFFFILMFMPETKHKTFKEIQMLMDHKFF